MHTTNFFLGNIIIFHSWSNSLILWHPLTVVEFACIMAYPPATKYFSGSDVSSWRTCNTPGFNCATTGTWPGPTPNSPSLLYFVIYMVIMIWRRKGNRNEIILQGEPTNNSSGKNNDINFPIQSISLGTIPSIHNNNIHYSSTIHHSLLTLLE